MRARPTICLLTFAVCAWPALGCDVDESPVATPEPEVTQVEDLPRRPAPSGGSTITTTPVERERLPSAVLQAIAAMDEVLWRCPDRVWPGLASFYKEQTQVLLVDSQAKRAWLWNDGPAAGAEAVVSEVPFDDLGPEWKALFNAGAVNGVHTLGVQMQPRVERDVWRSQLLPLLFHEAFHFQGRQPLWKLAHRGQTRAVRYPERWEPRHLRARMAQMLHKYVVTEETTALGHVVALQQEFVSSHADDAQQVRVTDIVEGSAQFAEMVSLAIANVGCRASDEALIRDIREHHSYDVGQDMFHGGGESYVLGLWAALALRMRGVKGWQAAVEAGGTPVEVLSEGIEPVEPPQDETLRSRVQSQVEERSRIYAGEVDQLLSRMKSPEHVRVAVPMSWLAGSFSTTGFLQLVNEPDKPEVIMDMQAAFKTPAGGSVRVETSVLRPARSWEPCLLKGPYVVAMLPRAALVQSSEGWRSDHHAVVFSGLAARLDAEQGTQLPWLCPEGSVTGQPGAAQSAIAWPSDCSMALILGTAAERSEKTKRAKAQRNN